MADRFITQVDEVNSLVNLETGEAKTHYQHLRVQSFADFFIACFAAWNDFKMSEGTMVKVFIHCIMSSTMSRGMGVEEEGNYFYVSDVYESIKRNNDLVGGGLEMKDVNVRQYIKKLADNCENGWFDPRNQYAAQTSKKIIDYFKEIDYPY